jgi:hypothetical protein
MAYMDSQNLEQRVRFVLFLPEEFSVLFRGSAMSGSYPDGDPSPDTFVFIYVEIEILEVFQSAPDQVKCVV